jgi:transcriptional regulator with XRE-family HTH domain
MDEIKLEESEFTDLGSEPLNDESITQEQINEMKMLGIPKHDSISWERWTRLQEIRYEHELMIHLAASGVSQKEISRQLGYDQAHVSKILNTPDVKARIRLEIENIYGQDHKKALKARGMKSLEVVDEILEFGKESEKAAMARWQLEHSVGKASQEIVERKTSLTEVIVKIEQMRSDQLRDVSPSQAQLSKPEDPFDNIINEIIPKGMVIGKRSDGKS